uniref:Uncharacterized protein n=1 Tax=Lactuca sativa TaxID=4236 RepID=A0A9R1VLM1_LACSA|nr:hypothetical protein LSAT_V11C500242660 [Lactuca sativa]
MLLEEFELEMEKESIKNLNPILYVVWLAGNRIGINSRFYLVHRKWNCMTVAATVVGDVNVGGNGGGDGSSGIDCSGGGDGTGDN